MYPEERRLIQRYHDNMAIETWIFEKIIFWLCINEHEHTRVNIQPRNSNHYDYVLSDDFWVHKSKIESRKAGGQT